MSQQSGESRLAADLPRLSTPPHQATRASAENPDAADNSVRIEQGLELTDSSPGDVIVVGGVPFTATSFDKAIAWLFRPLPAKRGQSIRLANAFCVAHAHADADYGQTLTSGGINFPDGTPVYWTMRLKSLGRRRHVDRVRGPSFFVKALDASQSTGAKHYFLGGTPESLQALLNRIRTLYPGVAIAGSEAPPFGPLSETVMDDWVGRINNSGATIVWIGLGTPKQDFASTHLSQRVSAYCVGVGAAFDFLAGTQKEAPRLFQATGLEWAYRLVHEPKRLWRRYLIGNLVFIRHALGTHRLIRPSEQSK